LITVLDKLSGLKAPTVQPEVQLQNDLLADPSQMPQEEKAK